MNDVNSHKELKLAFSTLGCPRWTLRQIVENAASMGFCGVELRGLSGDLDITTRPEFTTALADTAGLFADHGIAISCLSTSARYAVVENAERQNSLDETRRYLELAARLGAPVVRVFGGRLPDGHTRQSILPAMVESLRQMGDEARQFGTVLAVETHDDWTDSATLAALISRVDHPHVRVLWDLHHPFRLNGESPALTCARLGRYTVSVHLKDSLPDHRGGYHYVLPGKGNIPLREMVNLLLQRGYNGYLTLEWEKRWYPELPEPEVVFQAYVRTMRAWFPGPP
jgi:sugar phosphate isomerase/epimerase